MSADLPLEMVSASPSSDWSGRQFPNVICLFDVDGTLSASRQKATPDMLTLLKALKEKCVIGYVGGSDLVKQQEQLGEDAASHLFDFGFSENGATAFRLGKQIGKESLVGWMGEDRYQEFINWTLHYLADLDIPIKRGCFIELRNAMVNISPIGRNCNQSEREAFYLLDQQQGIRSTMVEAMKKRFHGWNLQFSIGGQISIDVFPHGWDKTFCLRHLEGEGFETIHFFGDKTMPGGNDYEIFHHPSVTGHTVTSPADTTRLIKDLFSL